MDLRLAASALGALLLLLVLIVRVRWSPFLALLFVSVVLALLAGVPLEKIPTLIEEGAGKTLGHIALIVALGAMIGRIVDRSGGAEAFANGLIARCGSKGLVLALAVAGFVIGIPVFFEVGVIILVPIAQGVAKKSHRPLTSLAIPMCGALLIVHALLPPHPGPVAVVSLVGAELGRVLAWGLPVAAMTTAVAVLSYRYLIAPRSYGSQSDAGAVVEARQKPENPPSRAAGHAPMTGGVVVGIVLFPISLILLGSLAPVFLAPDSLLEKALVIAGSPFVALMLDVILASALLMRRCGWNRQEVSEVVASAIPDVAVVILITGAGGAFARVLVESGIGSAVSQLLRGSGLPLLGTAFFLTLLLRAVQGPATVALITTAGILAPAVAAAGLSANHLALLCLAMGAGGIGLSHVNDPGFWFVTRLMGLSVPTGLRTWTVLTFFSSVVAFALLVGAWGLTQ